METNEQSSALCKTVPHKLNLYFAREPTFYRVVGGFQNSPPQADFFKDFGMAKYNFAKENCRFGSRKTQKIACGELMGTRNAPKSAYGQSFEGPIFRLCAKFLPQKVLMGKVLRGQYFAYVQSFCPKKCLCAKFWQLTPIPQGGG